MFTDFFRAFYYSFLIIAAGFSLLYFSKVQKAFKWLCMLVILTLVSELIARYLSVHFRPNSMVYHIFTPVEYAIYAAVYSLLFNNKKWTMILLASIACLVAAEVINSLFFQPVDQTPTNIMIAESVLLIFLSLKLFINIREAPVYENILTEGVFWFNCAVLFYYSFNILVWGFHNIKVYQLVNPPRIIYQILLLFSGLLYIAYAATIFLNSVFVKKSGQKT